MNADKVIILDRDGVINVDSKDYIKKPSEWRAIPGSLEAIAKLNQAGYQIFVATNQSGIGRGYYSLLTLADIHDKMIAELDEHGGQFTGIFFCPHTPDDNCLCRKPKTGLFNQIAKKFNLDLTNVYAVGDSLRDLQAAERAGCTPVLVKTGNGEKTLAENPKLTVVAFDDLSSFVTDLLG